MIPNVLSIAGVDPSGGAGIGADLKTFSALGAYGMSVVTALTAQNTHGVSGVELVAPAFVTAQIDAVFADVRVDAVKIGMVATADIARAIGDALRRHGAQHIVLDPVMVAKGGDRLLAEEAVAALMSELVPIAEIVTPNLPETAVLTGAAEPGDLAAMEAAGRILVGAGAQAALIKGGHLGGDDSVDVLVDASGVAIFSAPRIDTVNTHGTGCTLSSAIAALLPRYPRTEAVKWAKDYLTGAIAAADALDVGSGHGPVHHFHATWKL